MFCFVSFVSFIFLGWGRGEHSPPGPVAVGADGEPRGLRAPLSAQRVALFYSFLDHVWLRFHFKPS